MSQNSTVLGVVLLTRHGDRQGFYQSPDTYTPVETSITPLGLAQEYQLGQFLRSLYFNISSPSVISGVSTLFDQSQVRIRADAGGEGGVIFNSALAVSQAIWPADRGHNTTLANGTTIVAPLGGYQYVPIESVEPETDVSLEGWTECNAFTAATLSFYNSSEFTQVANASADFLSSLRPLVGPDRPLKLRNMWNIFDFLNVQSIHDQSLSQQITPETLSRARALANWHQYHTFSSAELAGVGNIAGQTVLPDILSSLRTFANGTQPLKFTYLSLSYKPFISLFNMTGVAEAYPELAGIVDYASAMTFELRKSPSGTPVVRMNFKNGSDPTAFTTYNMFGGEGDIPLDQFASRLEPYAVNDLGAWCAKCNNWQDRKCDLVGRAQAHWESDPISPLGAGFIGAGVTIAVFLAALGALAFMGLVVFGRKARKGSDHPVLPIVTRDSTTSSVSGHAIEKTN